jgi:hypothetical protein
VYEYGADELRSALETVFTEVRMFGQVLHERFVISPFQQDQIRLPRTLCNRLRLLVWRVLYRLPSRLRDGASSALWGHPLLPTADDYRFDEAAVEDAPVLVAVAARPRVR